MERSHPYYEIHITEAWREAERKRLKAIIDHSLNFVHIIRMKAVEEPKDYSAISAAQKKEFKNRIELKRTLREIENRQRHHQGNYQFYKPNVL